VGTFTADRPWVCGVPSIVTFTAVTKNVTSFTWDFADGTVSNTQSQTVSHTYQTPGLYKPAILVKDDKGCIASFELKVPLIVDTLQAAFSASPSLICDSALVLFTLRIVNIAADQLHLLPAYHWNFGTGNPEDTANIAAASFFYNKPGKYNVSLTVTSAGGCVRSVVKEIEVKRKTKAAITAAAETCLNDGVPFAATADGTVQKWTWQLETGVTQTGSAAASHAFSVAGDYKILLMAENEGCIDTAVHWLKVHSLPDIGLLPGKKATLCLADSLQLTAHNGVAYIWTPALAISNPLIALPRVSPVTNTTYVVQVIDGFGCRNKDSVLVQLAYPFTVALPDTGVCRGSSVQLAATGADHYKWIAGTNLSNANIGNPLASPLTSEQYKVVGYDAYGCFTDTVTATVTVHNLPAVNTISDTVLLAGNAIILQTQGSNDVVSYKWFPPLYLDCASCASPVSTPRTALTYVVTAATMYGCKARDSVTVGLRCAESAVFIPNTFTPNKDRRNDLFYPRGKGIKVVKFFRIYNRLGEMVFERRNFELNDPAQGWDGSYSGNSLANNLFTYTSEMICDAGDAFVLKGTVLLLH
jgi:gliding motility-associated-like protein